MNDLEASPLPPSAPPPMLAMEDTLPGKLKDEGVSQAALREQKLREEAAGRSRAAIRQITPPSQALVPLPPTGLPPPLVPPPPKELPPWARPTIHPEDAKEGQFNDPDDQPWRPPTPPPP